MTGGGAGVSKSQICTSHEKYGEVLKNPLDDHAERFWFSRTIE
jgi:hypothetical protein